MPQIPEQTVEVVMLTPQERVRQRTVERTVDVPGGLQRQLPTIQTAQKTVDVQKAQCIDKVVDMPVAMLRQTLVIQRMQKTVESPQFIDTVVQRQVPWARELRRRSTCQSSHNAGCR